MYDFTSTVYLSSITPIIRTSQLVHHHSYYGERNQRYYLDQERITYSARVSILHRTSYGDHPQRCNLLLHRMAYGYCHHLYHHTPYGDILILINHHSYPKSHATRWLTTPDNAFHTENFLSISIYTVIHTRISYIIQWVWCSQRILCGDHPSMHVIFTYCLLFPILCHVLSV